jgi:hypothetical protein
MKCKTPEPKHVWRLAAIAAPVVLVAGCSPETESQPVRSGSVPASTPTAAGQSMSALRPSSGTTPVRITIGDVGYWDGITRIGRLDGSLDALSNQSGDFTAKVELSQ